MAAAAPPQPASLPISPAFRWASLRMTRTNHHSNHRPDRWYWLTLNCHIVPDKRIDAKAGRPEGVQYNTTFVGWDTITVERTGSKVQASTYQATGTVSGPACSGLPHLGASFSSMEWSQVVSCSPRLTAGG